MIKATIVLSLIFLSGCQTIPDFPNVFSFQSQQDLLDQEREIHNSFKEG